MFERRIISIAQYIQKRKSENSILDFVYQQEQQEIIRLSQQLLDLCHIEFDNTTTPRVLSKLFISTKKRHASKVMRSYYERKIMDDPKIDKQLSDAWIKDKYLTSEVENYISVVQDQELPTKFLKNKRDRDSGKNPNCNNKCRLCINNVEDINNIVAGCSQMSARYCLPLTHDEVAKTVLNSHMKKFCPDKQITLSSDAEFIYKEHPREYWWNISIKTATKIPHNKPDLVIWNEETKLCSIIEFSCPLDTNISRKVNEKLETYGPLI